MAPLPNLATLIDLVRADVGSDDPLEQLSHAAESVGELERVGDSLLGHFVESCRESGCSWTEISAALGVSRQAAHKRFATSPPTFERFTERARMVLRDATDQARSFGQSLVGTEHLLLALFEPAEAIAAQVLAEAGLSRSAVEEFLAANAGPRRERAETAEARREIRYSLRARQALRHAVDEALGLGHNYIGTEHLLLGLFDDPDAFGARILSSLGVGYEETRDRIGAKFEALRRAREGGTP